jgi:hypothetical protein
VIHTSGDVAILEWRDPLSEAVSSCRPAPQMRLDFQRSNSYERAGLMRTGDGNEVQRPAPLKEHRSAVRAQLAAVRGHLAFIDRKIAIYEERLHG